MARKILHFDLDAFFCAVEELHDPKLKGKPFAVGGQANQRGVVASCSYPARAFGVHSAMPMSRALRLCPDLIVVSSHHGNYSEVSKQVMALMEITPFIEQISIDEAFMDVTGIPEPLEDIALSCRNGSTTSSACPSHLVALRINWSPRSLMTGEKRIKKEQHHPTRLPSSLPAKKPNSSHRYRFNPCGVSVLKQRTN